jgi:hypothetical protein
MSPRSLLRPWLLLLLVPVANSAPRAPEAAITLSTAKVPATGKHNADVTVTRFGRYALTASSLQGTAIQLVDRMSGPGEVQGIPGEANGRVDTFLERGSYRVRTISDLAGTGNAQLEAHAFVEQSPSPPPMLPDVVTVSTTLADFQQRSWWISLDADEDFAVEMAGRSLADIRVWRDGQWLDPATPRCADIAPNAKKPLRRCEFTARLGAGLWQVVAYGGASVPWAINDPAQPLHVRRGATTLADAGRLDGVVGPFGTERWLVPGEATHYRLELPEGAPASVRVADYISANPYRDVGISAEIVKETLPPAATAQISRSGAGRVVTVSGAEGQPFVLQHFPAAGRSISVRGTGGWYFSTMHAGDPADRPDVTGTLAEVKTGAAPIWTSFLPLTKAQPYRRKFNLLGQTALDFDITEEAEYQFIATSDVKWRWEPYLTSLPKGYSPPAFRTGPATTPLAVGRWTLTLEPTVPGVAEVVVRADASQVVEPSPPRSNLTIPAIQLETSKSYALTLNRTPDTAIGLVKRTLPITFGPALPVTLMPGQTLTLPVVVVEQGTLSSKGLQLSVGGPFAGAHEVPMGAPVVTLRNDTAGTVSSALTFTAKEASEARLPPLPDTAVTTPPPLPTLTARAARALDLERQASATYRMDVETPGLYRLESTGLLATAGAIRTRTRPLLSSAAVNGTGRNFLLQTYLREGDYQVSVGTQDQSAGHLGLRLVPAPMRDGGAIRPEVPARAALAAGEGVTYTFQVEAGEYVLRSFGQGRVFRVRLEDADGWPLLAPEVDGDLRLTLDKGSYRLTVLPEAVATTGITLLERVPEPVPRQGHGPHALALDSAAPHVWWESSNPREPDVWTFDLDADADLTITATSEMAGELYKSGAADAVSRLVPGRPWTGRLEAGSYHLDLSNARRNSGVSYTVNVQPAQLVPGLSRMSNVPGELAVSVGPKGLVELSSMGIVDVRARLFDAEGHAVGASDDRPEDWNFRIAERLPEGIYKLKIEPVGVARGQVRVHMGATAESDAPALSAGEARTLTPGSGVVRIPLTVGTEGVLVASADSTENVEIALERQDGGVWRTVGASTGAATRVVARLAEGPWRLRLTSLDGRGVPSTVRTSVVTPRNISESALASGVSVQAERGLAIAQVKRAEPGLLELVSRVGVSWCPAPGAACVEAETPVLAAPDPEVWLVAETKQKAAILRANRVVLERTPVRATLPAGRAARVAIAASPGPVLVVAHAEGGQPGLRLGVPGDVAWHDAFAVSLKGGAPAELYAAAGAGDLEVDLTRIGFDAPELGAVSGGRASGALAAGGAWAGDLGLPTGGPLVPAEPSAGKKPPKPPTPSVSAGRRVVLSLGEGLVAAIVHDGAIASVHSAADGARVETVEGPADRLIVMNPTGKAVPWSVNVLPLGGAAATLGAGPLERLAPAAGSTRVVVPVGTRGVLHLGGAALGAQFVGTTGALATDARDIVIESGTLTVDHGPGAWIAWVDDGTAEGAAKALWGSAPPPAGAMVSLPATPPLGAALEAFRLVAPGPGVMRFAAGQPVVALLRHDGGKARAVLAVDGVVTWRVASGESWDIAVRPVGGGALRGQAELTHVPATPLEGVGQAVVVAPGEARAWSFTVTKDGPIGLGVRTDSRDLTVTLVGADGAELGRGMAQMPSLKAGSYLLVASLPASSTPAAVRPAVVGLVPPDTGPPEDVIRAYLVEAGVLQ